MLHNLPIFHRVRPHLVFIAIALVAILAIVACSESDDTQETPEISSDGLALVWEAWEQISENYVSSEPLDADAVVSGAMGRLLNEVEISPYPFLTEIGRMRGQPPAEVPSEMVDLWRAVAKYQAANLEFDSSTVAESVVTGLLEGLIDSSAVYLDATQYPLAKESLEGGLEGSYLGIGSRVVARDGQIVLFPFAGSPSESAGILPGDVLVAVAGASVLGQSVQDVVDQVAGP